MHDTKTVSSTGGSTLNTTSATVINGDPNGKLNGGSFYGGSSLIGTPVITLPTTNIPTITPDWTQSDDFQRYVRQPMALSPEDRLKYLESQMAAFIATRDSMVAQEQEHMRKIKALEELVSDYKNSVDILTEKIVELENDADILRTEIESINIQLE